MIKSQPPSVEHIYQDMLAASMILTRIPVSWNFDAEPDTRRCYWAFPAIGIGVAAIPGIIGSLLIMAGIPALAAAMLALGGVMLLTGGLHQDGLADVADGLGGRDAAHRLAIMRDSATGSFGTLALVVFTLTSAACLAELGGGSFWGLLHALVASAALSRGMMALQRCMHTTPDENGLAHLTGQPGWTTTLISLLLGVMLAVAFVGIEAAMAGLLTGAVATLALGRFLHAWIGGVNGDGLGATQQISESIILMTFVMMI